MRKLQSYQYNVISRFCEDFAKGLVIAVALGQITVVSESVSIRILTFVISILETLLMLYLAVYFSREIR